MIQLTPGFDFSGGAENDLFNTRESRNCYVIGRMRDALS